MQQLPYSSSPIARFMAVAIATVVFALSLIVGATLFLALLGMAAVALTIFYVRLRWRLRKSARGRPRPTAAGGQIIEGEYVVERVRERERER